MKTLLLLATLLSTPAYAGFRTVNMGIDDVVSGATYVPSTGLELSVLKVNDEDGFEANMTCEVSFLSPDISGRVQFHGYYSDVVLKTDDECKAALIAWGKKINAHPKSRITIDYDANTMDIAPR